MRVCLWRHAPSETRNYSKATENHLAAQNGRRVRQPGASIALRQQQQQREAQNGKFSKLSNPCISALVRATVIKFGIYLPIYPTTRL